MKEDVRVVSICSLPSDHVATHPAPKPQCENCVFVCVRFRVVHCYKSLTHDDDDSR